jgi:molybdopterin-guanine dinucleotide biosynthesis protein A
VIAPLFGLVLSGGLSARMGRDKGSLVYHGVDQRTYCSKLLSRYCEDVYVSVRGKQTNIDPRLKVIFDPDYVRGPAAGILAAHELLPSHAWLVLACDMPYVTEGSVSELTRHRNPSRAATAYTLQTIEPLFAIWEPQSLSYLKQQVLLGNQSPRHALEELSCELLDGDPSVLKSIDTPTNI